MKHPKYLSLTPENVKEMKKALIVIASIATANSVFAQNTVTAPFTAKLKSYTQKWCLRVDEK